MDTIFALATARGKSGVAIIRISGARALDVARDLAGDLPGFHQARLRRLTDSDGSLIDEALVVCFPSGQSFTGEESVELQTHGSPAVIAALLRFLSDQDGLRVAEPGEFTRRALENDRMDLSEIEGLGDLIDAETEAQRIQAMRVFSGHLGAKAEMWRKDLLRAMALIEATIDFADEEVPTDVNPEVFDLLKLSLDSLRAEHSGTQWAERVRDGFRVAILGAPNVGKSTLLNYLAGREVAITSSIAGTTRDVVEARLDVKGIPVSFLDTAGLRETTDVIESIGVSRAKQTAEEADLRVILINSQDQGLGLEPSPQDLILRAKCDDGQPGGISGATGAGVVTLLDHVAEVFERRVASVGASTKERHRIAISRAMTSIEVAIELLESDQGEPELIAEELRTAVHSIQSLVGRIDIEHVLGEIFSSFCIGK